MTTSRSIALASNRAARLLAVFAAACVYLFGVDAGVQSAEAQKRVVVLSFNSVPFTGGAPGRRAGQEFNVQDARQVKWTDPGGSVNDG